MSDWQHFWDAISVAQVVGWLVGIIAVVTFFVKGWPKIRAFVRLVDALAELPKFMTDTTKTLEAQDVKIEQIHHEVNYNNGSSVKDAIHRVEIGVKGLYERADATDQAGAARDVQISSARGAIVELRDDLEHTRPAVIKKPARKRTPKPPTEGASK